MKEIITITLAFCLVASTSANPLLVPRAVTPDNTCGLVGNGNNKGYTCSTTVPGGGRCCSTNGWCGEIDVLLGFRVKTNEINQVAQTHIVEQAVKQHMDLAGLNPVQQRKQRLHQEPQH